MVQGKTNATPASLLFPQKETRREPKELDSPAAREKCDGNDLEVELDAHLDLPLKG